MKRAILAALAIFGYSEAREALSESKVLELLDTLPRFGTLKRSNDFLYVDIDDAYIHQLSPLIEGFAKPPYFDRSDLVGAHISVAFPEEIGTIPEIAECGTQIAFVPKRCEIVRLATPSPFLPNIDELYLVVIEAPQLDRIREKYGLPKSRHAFHITVGVK